MDAEKKKLVAIGGLALAILGIGAFNFLGGPPPPAPAAERKKPVEAPKDEAAPPAKNPMYAAALAVRDPFATPGTGIVTDAPVAAIRVGATPSPTPPASPPPVASHHELPAIPQGLGGMIPPLPVGEVGSGLPTAVPPGATAHPMPTQAPVIVPATSASPAPIFAGRLVGVVVGARSLAVFEGANGVQRLVPVGSALDSDTTLVGIRGTRATVRFHGKLLRLKVSDAPASPKPEARSSAPLPTPSPEAPQK